MIFSPALARKVLAGQKTQTRRPVKEGKDCRYRPHHNYAVCPGRGKPESGRILITEVREERVGDISLRDARAEGFRTTIEFKAAWLRLYDESWVEAHDLPATGLVLSDEMIADRFEERHADTSVWVIEFTLPVDPIRLLADRHAKSDYVDTPARAMPDEPEAVDERSLQRIVDRSGMESGQWQAVQDAQRESQSLDTQLRELLHRADRMGLDVRRQEQSIRQRIRQLRAVIDRKAAA